MTRPSKRQAQIRRLAEAKVRLNRDDVEDTNELSSELSGVDETSSESSSDDSSDESIVIEPSRQISDVLEWHDEAGKGKGSGLRSSYSGSSKSTRKR